MTTPDRFASALVGHRRLALVLLLVTTLIVGAGVTQLQEDTSLQAFDIGTTEEAKQEYVESNFSATDRNETVAQIVVRDENVLDRESLLWTLELQQRIRANDTVSPTLTTERPTAGVANVVGRAAVRTVRPDIADPTLEQQIVALEAMNETELDRILGRVLTETESSSTALAFLPSEYDAGESTANATMIAVFQSAGEIPSPGNAPADIVDSQTTIAAIASAESGGMETMVVGDGIITHETEQSRSDTFQLVGPLALLFVLLTLAVVYRDLLDVLLSVVGIVLVQVWTFGMLGWVGIAFNPILIAIPVLLIGLSIDYGIHVFLRYRERRHRRGESVTEAMTATLGTVGVALLWVTITTAVGFLSNVASPVKPIQELGLISAIGIVGALVVFGGVVPLLKVERDRLAARLGRDRSAQSGAPGSGFAGRLLSVGATAARRAPVAVVVLTLLLTAFTTVGAMQVSTSFGPEDHIPGETAAWTDELPEPFAPGEYTAKENLQYVDEHFVSHDAQAEILVEGAVTNAGTLERLAQAEREAATAGTAVSLANGEARTRSPLTLIQRVAAVNESFNETVAAADTDGDGVPDRNAEGVYDHLFAVAPDEATTVLHRADGEYRALRLSVSVVPSADGQEVTDDMETLAGILEGNDRTATATGDPIVRQLIQDHLVETVLVSLALTLLAVTGILAGAYRIAHGSATLGIVTVLPVVFCVSWIIATMYVLGYPLSVLTSIVASITIGIGIDYSIHVSERFSEELDRTGSVEKAVGITTRGTGGALLGSAATTAAGFGVLSVAFLPSLQQFGTITALMIVYAFLGSVLALPSLLVLWARYFGPQASPVSQSTPAQGGEMPED